MQQRGRGLHIGHNQRRLPMPEIGWTRVGGHGSACNRPFIFKKFHTEYQRLKQERRALRFEDITRRLADAAMLDDADRVAFRLDAAVSASRVAADFVNASSPLPPGRRELAARMSARLDSATTLRASRAKSAVE